MNETPEFMKACLIGVRRNWRVKWCVKRAAKKSGVEFEAVLDRPKTPALVECNQEMSHWLARNFFPVFEAIVDGKPDDEILKLWISTDRKIVRDTRFFSKKERKEIRHDGYIRRTTRTVSARSLSKRHDWATVK